MLCSTLVGDSLNTVLVRVLWRKRTNGVTIYDKGDVLVWLIHYGLDRPVVAIFTQKKLRMWYLLRS